MLENKINKGKFLPELYCINYLALNLQTFSRQFYFWKKKVSLEDSRATWLIGKRPAGYNIRAETQTPRTGGRELKP